MDNQKLSQFGLENFSNSSPLKIDTFSIQEFDNPAPLPTVRRDEKDYLSLFLKFFSLVLALFFLLVLLNLGKAKSLRFLKDSMLIAPEVRNAVYNLGKRVEDYYNFLLGKSQNSNRMLLRVDIDRFVSDLSGIVAGAQVERRAMLGLGYQPVIYFEHLQEEWGKKDRRKDSKVLGENIFFSEKINSLLREGKELTAKIVDSAKAAKVKLEDFEEFIKNSAFKSENQELVMLISEVKITNEKAREFISQAEKTGNYYYLIYDINLELTPQLVSYIELLKRIATASDSSIYLSQLDDFQYNLLKLQGKLRRVAGEDLPFGLEDLHSDNLKVFDLLNENVKEVKIAIAEKKPEKIMLSLVKLNSTLQPLYERSKTLEMNFWQNNRSLREYGDIVEGYNKIEQKINVYLMKNKSFFLEYLSQFFG